MPPAPDGRPSFGMDPTVPPAAFLHDQLAVEPFPPGLMRSVGGRPHPICSCRRPPVIALPPPLTGGGLGEENIVQLGLVAEKFLLSANNIEKLESFQQLTRLLPQQAPVNEILVISYRYSDLLHLFVLEARQPPSVIYKLLSHQRACSLRALPDMLFCKYFSRSSSSASTDYTPMEAAPSVSRIIVLQLHMHPTDLCSLVLRVIPKLLGQSPSLLNKKTLLIEPTLPELPVDILMHVFATLDIPDLVRAGSVCTSWFSAYATLRKLGKHKQPQTPCLLYTSESAGEGVACLYSLVEKRVYKLNLPKPPIRRRFLIGSSLGLLITVDERSEMHLINPITCEQISLPSVTTIQQVKPIRNDSGVVYKYQYSMHTAKRVMFRPQIIDLDALREHLHHKAFVFFDTSTGSYIVVLIHRPRGQLSFARVGDDKWTWLPPHTYYMDCTYKDGLLYAATQMGEVHAFDLSGPAVTMNIIVGMDEDLDVDGIHILEAPWGGLLVVWRFKVYLGHPHIRSARMLNTKAIKIHEVDAAAKKLVEIDRLHDHALFLGNNQSLCLSTKEYPALKENCAYLTDDSDGIAGDMNNPRDIGILDLDNNTRKELVFPQLWSNWPAPVWITPNPTMMKLALNKSARFKKS